MKYITVLDFEDGNVYQYEIEDEHDAESLIDQKGHKITNCEWMVHNNKGINREHETYDDIQVIINGHRYKIS